MNYKCFLAGLTFFALAACGGGGSDDSDGGATSTPEMPAPEQPAYNRDHLEQINANIVHLAGMTGAGATVAVIDTGIRGTHVAFDGPRKVIGYDTLENDGDRTYSGTAFTDEAGHNTAVASLAAGKNVGVAPGANLAVFKVASGSFDQADSIHPKNTKQALGEIARRGGVDVINISANAQIDPDSVAATDSIRDRVVAGIREQDWVLVIATNKSGNTYGGAAYADAPVFEGQVLVVGAVNQENQLADISATATSVPDQTDQFGRISGVIEHFLVAPAAPVCTAALPSGDVSGSCQIGQAAAGPNTVYGYDSGTSFATPLVSGAVAVLRAEFPELDGSEVVDILLDSATDLGAPGVDGIYGAGLLNVNAAVQLAMRRTTPDDGANQEGDL